MAGSLIKLQEVVASSSASITLGDSYWDTSYDVYMVKVSFNQKPYRRALMETFGARCIASPSIETEIGQKILAENPESTGSLGIAISEAVEQCVKSESTKYFRIRHLHDFVIPSLKVLMPICLVQEVPS